MRKVNDIAHASHASHPSHSPLGASERATQTRVIALFQDELDYHFLGDWTDRDNNSCVEESLLTPWLKKRFRHCRGSHAPWQSRTPTGSRSLHQPANMRLLVVVDKLLTGFDAPPCTFLYIDKSMQDHGLFQAICRPNRLDGDDKDFGYIADYKGLFKKVENAIAVYTSELDRTAPGADPEVMLQDRLTKGRERLDEDLEAHAPNARHSTRARWHLCAPMPTSRTNWRRPSTPSLKSPASSRTSTAT